MQGDAMTDRKRRFRIIRAVWGKRGARDECLRSELAAAKWQLRRERRWAAGITASYAALQDERDALRRELDNLTGEL